MIKRKNKSRKDFNKYRKMVYKEKKESKKKNNR